MSDVFAGLGDDDDVAEENASVFVKNLNFATTEDALHHFFAGIGQIRCLRACIVVI